MEIPRIAPEEVKRRLDSGEPVTFLDTRAAEAWRKADTQIPDSTRVPPDSVEEHLYEIPRGRLIVTYCT